MLLQKAEFHSSSWLSSIPLCVCVCVCVCIYHIFFIQSSVDGHFGCFPVLAIVNNAAMNIGVHVSFQIGVDSIYNVTPSFHHPPDSCSFPPPPTPKPLSLQQPYSSLPPPFFGSGHPMFRHGLWIWFWLCGNTVKADSFFSNSGQESDIACGTNLQKIVPNSQ